MANLFRPAGSVNKPSPPATALRIQQSSQGKARTIGWGQNRIAGNLLWAGTLVAQPVQTSGGGGKGSGGGGKGSGKNTGTYNYSIPVAIGLCEGPINNVFNIWYNKSKTSLSAAGGNSGGVGFGISANALGLTLFTGAYSQSPWGFLTSAYPGQDLNYRGDAYVATQSLLLGESPELPNFTFETRFNINSAYAGTTDAN